MFKKLSEFFKHPGNSDNDFEVAYSDIGAHKTISRHLLSHMISNTVILCIGSTKLSGDSLGPKVGALLSDKGLPYPIFGTMKDPVHALNIENTYRVIKSSYPDSPILAVDAGIAASRNKLGHILVTTKPLVPGTGVGKNLMPVGSISITGFVCIAYNNPSHCISLANADHKLVNNMASIIAGSILMAHNQRMYSEISCR